MKELENEDLKKLLKKTLPAAGGAELQRDLWPAMLRRLDARPIHVPWWDWALLGGVSALILFFPGMIPVLLYHL
jgi:hypothetical protein